MFLLIDVVVQELDDQVNVCEDHPSAAVAFASQLVKRVAKSKYGGYDVMNTEFAVC